MKTLQFILIIIAFSGTLFLVFVSRKSLLSLKLHGFNRFFVFESCLLLVLLNLPFWFNNPLSVIQIISWISLIISLYLLFQSVYLLKRIGGQGKRENVEANYNFENTSSLVKEGIYKYIRHPMYGSLLFLSFGALLKNISSWSISILIVSILFLILTAKAEEKENIAFFGSLYSDYMKETKMFVPFIL